MPNDHDDIRRHFESFAAALHDKDLERATAHYAPNALAFDLAPPLQHRRGGHREPACATGSRSWSSPGSATRRATPPSPPDGAVAFAHSLSRFSGTRTDGTTT